MEQLFDDGASVEDKTVGLCSKTSLGTLAGTPSP